MKSVHPIITVILWNLSLLQRGTSGYYNKIFKSIKRIKIQLLNYCFEEEKYKIYMPGGIYQ